MNPEALIKGILSPLFEGGNVPRGWQTLAALLVAALLLLLWQSIRRDRTGGRFGAALVLLAAAFAVDSITPWWPRDWRAGVALRAVALLAFFFGLVRGAVVYLDLVARRRRADFSTILRDLVTILLYGIVVLVVLRVTVDVNLTSLLATSALVTAVIGLALQETLGNVFSGLSLQAQKPFEPGDWIRFGTHLGRVQGIGWRSTALVTRNLETLDIPNGVLAREIITNYRGRAVGDDLYVGIVYGTPPNRVKEVVLEVLRHVPGLAKEPAPLVWVVEYGDFAIRYRIRFWLNDFSMQDFVRDEIMTDLWYAFRRNGIEIPFPIRTLYMHEAKRVEGAHEDAERERAAALRQVDFLAELSDGELDLLVPSVREVVFGRGETVCREGDTGETFYVVRRGMLDVVTRANDGREVHVAELRAPAFFGEMSLLTGEPRAATVRARTDARLLVVMREGFEQLFRSRPEFAERVSEIVDRRQSELRETRERSTSTESAESRRRRLLTRMQSIFRF